MQPLVSIIIPTYNRAHLLKETLDSVLVQTYINWECIVIDDGSTDETSGTVQDYIKKDSRFQFHIRPSSMPKGANSCRNFGFQVSKGEYVNWLDDDDLFSKNKIEEQLNLLKKSGSLIATCKWGRFENICKFKTKELPIYRDYEDGYELIRDYGETKTFFPSHAFMLNRNILTKAGLWNEDLTINQDGEFFTRVLLNCSGVKHSNEAAVYYRQSLKEDSVSSFSSNEKARDAILSWILIDTYIKIYTKSSKSCKYVINAKQYLKQEIKEIEILKEYSFFLGKKTLLSLGKQLIKKWF